MLDNIDPKAKKYILYSLVAVVAIIAITIIASFTYQKIVFKVTNITPDTTSFPTAVNSVEVKFNKNVENGNNTIDDITLEPAILENAYYIDDTLYIELTTPPNSDDNLTVVLDNITADSGSKLSQTIDFNVTYVAPSDMTDKQLEKIRASTDRFEEQYKLVHELPIKTDKYYIDYELPTHGSNKMPIIIRMDFAATMVGPDNPGTYEQQVEKYKQKVIQYRKQAIKRLVKLGLNNDLYFIQFVRNIYMDPSPEQLIDKYNAQLNKD